MKVFISWSGDLSNKIAEAYNMWLPGALQSVKPYFTPSDIEKGARWSTEISKELETSEVGVLFITRENLGSEWLLYEAGALSKRLEKSRVCPVIFGLTPTDLQAPLRQFQATEFNREDFKKLLKTINAASGENRLTDPVLDSVFDKWWPELKETIDKILAAEDSPGKEEPLLSEIDMLKEILALSRLRSKQGVGQSSIPPHLMEELISSLMSCHDAIQGTPNPQAAIIALGRMRDLMLHNFTYKRSEGNIHFLLDELDNLSFEYEPEDDIPF